MNIISANLFEHQCNYNNSFVNMNKTFCFFLCINSISIQNLVDSTISLTHKLFFLIFAYNNGYFRKNNRIYGYILC